MRLLNSTVFLVYVDFCPAGRGHIPACIHITVAIETLSTLVVFVNDMGSRPLG